jgi:hypothetical protein
MRVVGVVQLIGGGGGGGGGGGEKGGGETAGGDNAGGDGGGTTGQVPDEMYWQAACGVVRLAAHPAVILTVTLGVVDVFPLHPRSPETPCREAGVFSPGFCRMMTRSTIGPPVTFSSPAVDWR